MIEIQKYMRWSDSLSYTKKSLNELTLELKKTSTAYQKYLKSNPHKEKKVLLESKKKKAIERILTLVEQGAEKYDGK